MIPRGSMRGTKKVLGIALAIMALGFTFQIQQIQDLVMNYPIISIGILYASAYLLFISGRRQWQ